MLMSTAGPGGGVLNMPFDDLNGFMIKKTEARANRLQGTKCHHLRLLIQAEDGRIRNQHLALVLHRRAI